MPEQDELERSYQRLLRAYPGFYRRERGLEILTTLLDAARPGQVRATFGEAVHLIASGLRLRLVPPGWAGKTAAGIATLWMAVVLGGVGAYLAWDDPSARPALDDPRIAALGDALVGQPTSRVSIDASDPLDMAYSYKAHGLFQTLAAEDLPEVTPVPAGHLRIYEHVATGGVLTAAQRRLQEEGWQTGAVTRPEGCGCGALWAVRDGLLLRVSDYRPDGRESTVLVDVYQVEPNGVLAAALAGFAVGLVVPWPVTAWLAHRFARLGRGDQALVLLFGAAVLYACLANTVDNVLSMVPDPDTDSMLLATDLMYPLANQVANPLAATVIAVGLAGCVGIVHFTPWQRRRANSATAESTIAEV
ncbi:hypothetical protein [Catellatospora vulcania]|uniref:hypothetical protein n=1 Tax=Catellatospora vulcania TaxID=1460450 RepID=UPI0012D421C9|nr:hypothetical protein [Catellatospora vulcania]